jgi:hypothetical protein
MCSNAARLALFPCSKKKLRACVLDHMTAVAAVRLLLLDLVTLQP